MGERCRLELGSWKPWVAGLTRCRRGLRSMPEGDGRHLVAAWVSGGGTEDRRRRRGFGGTGELKATPVIGERRNRSRGGSAEAGLCGGERDADWAHGGSDRIREQWLQRLGCP